MTPGPTTTTGDLFEDDAQPGGYQTGTRPTTPTPKRTTPLKPKTRRHATTWKDTMSNNSPEPESTPTTVTTTTSLSTPTLPKPRPSPTSRSRKDRGLPIAGHDYRITSGELTLEQRAERVKATKSRPTCRACGVPGQRVGDPQCPKRGQKGRGRGCGKSKAKHSWPRNFDGKDGQKDNRPHYGLFPLKEHEDAPGKEFEGSMAVNWEIRPSDTRMAQGLRACPRTPTPGPED